MISSKNNYYNMIFKACTAPSASMLLLLPESFLIVLVGKFTSDGNKF